MRPFKIYEVSAREGFQQQAARPTAQVVALIKKIYAAGIRHVEGGSLVNPKIIPAMANTAEVLTACQALPAMPDLQLSVLIPRPTLFKQAADLGVAQVAVAISREEKFQEKNFHQTIAQALAGLKQVYQMREQYAPAIKIKVYLMMAWINERPLVQDVALLQAIAPLADEVCLADTAAKATTATLREHLKCAQEIISLPKLGLHLHGPAAAVLELGKVALQAGVVNFDTALGGGGGCPFIDQAQANADTYAFCQMLQAYFPAAKPPIDLAALASAASLLAPVKSPTALQ